MSSAASGVNKAAKKAGSFAGDFAGALGIDDPKTQGFIRGGTEGMANPFLIGASTAAGLSPAGGSIAGGIKGAFEGRKKAEQDLENARAAAEAQESDRQAFNKDIFDLAQTFSGKITQNPGFDFEDKLSFVGEDPRQKELEQLLSVFTRRSNEVQEQRFSPGMSQTRLSLVE